MGRGWRPYDPAWLVEAARELAPEEPWLPNELARCTRCIERSAAMIYFVDPSNANKPGSEWQFETNVIIEHPSEGTLVLDVLKGNRIGGLEFLDRLE